MEHEWTESRVFSNSAVPEFLGKEFLLLSRHMKKTLKTFPAFMSFLATASTSNLKEDGYVLEFSLENGDTFWCLERDF